MWGDSCTATRTRLINVGSVIGEAWIAGRDLQFSFELPAERELPRPERLGLEVDLIAAFHGTMGRNPDCQFTPGERATDVGEEE